MAARQDRRGRRAGSGRSTTAPTPTEAIDLLEEHKDSVFLSPAVGIMWANVYEGAEYGTDTAMAEKMGSMQALRAMTELYPELRKRGLRVLPGGDYGFPNNPIGRNARDLDLFAGLTGAKVAGVVAWFPVTDLAGLPSDIADAGGVPDPGPDSREALFLGAPASSVPELARAASPVAAHASASAPPVLLMRGAVDDMVPAAQSVRLAEALRAAGAAVELEIVPGATHFWNGADDIPGIVSRSTGFLRACAEAL